MNTLRVSRNPEGQPEIFKTLQGEGPSAGTPTGFLRLATCNLKCSWCDTKYTWDWSQYDYSQEVATLATEDVRRRIDALGTNRLVITGGEPLMQQRALAPLASGLKSGGYSCEIETNGTLAPSADMVSAIDQWNVSPKLANSHNAIERRHIPNALQVFRNLDNAYFKFVVVEPEDLAELDDLIERYSIPKHRVLLMPEGTTPETLDRRSSWLAEACTDRGYRFTTRLHILLWGDKRGR